MLGKTRGWMPVFFSILILMACGCAHPPVRNYEAFALTGAHYASVMQGFLSEATNRHIDVSSERLFRAMLKKHGNKPGTILTPAQRESLEKDYLEKKKIDKERIEILQRAINHMNLFRKYCLSLYALAASDVPGQAQISAENAANALNHLGNKIRKDYPKIDAQVIGMIASLAVKKGIRRALQQEIEARKTIIDRELATQAVFFSYLRELVVEDIKKQLQLVERRKVLNPYLTAYIKNPDAWIRERRKLLLLETNIKEIEGAQLAAENLRKAWEELITGGPEAQLNQFLGDVEATLNLLETIIGKRE